MVQMSHIRRLRGCNSGASAVEFAIIAPVFLALLFGIVVFGAYLAVVHGVQQLAAEAAHTSIAGSSDAERNSLAVGYVTANANSYPLLTPSHLTVNAAVSNSDANVYVVTVNYDASGLFIYSLPFVPTSSRTIVRAAAIPRGGY